MKIDLKKIIYSSLILLINLLPLVTLGAYQLLEPSVMVNNPGGSEVGLADYLRSAYLMLFIVVITSAIIFLIIDGIKLMTTDLPIKIANSKQGIWRALGGLFIALISFLLLSIINPNLVKLENLKIPEIS